MLTRHTVCLCYGYEKCEAETKLLAEKNGAALYEVIALPGPYRFPFEPIPAYKGVLIMEKED